MLLTSRLVPQRQKAPAGIGGPEYLLLLEGTFHPFLQLLVCDFLVISRFEGLPFFVIDHQSQIGEGYQLVEFIEHPVHKDVGNARHRFFLRFGRRKEEGIVDRKDLLHVVPVTQLFPDI